MTDTEINEAVARKLGWKNPCLFPNQHDKLHFDCPFKLPDYCHSIEAAWEGIDKFLSDRTRLCIFELHKNNTSQWYAKFEIRDENYAVYDDIAETAARAICLAFLKLP